VLVVFIGGVTFTEISALRFLSKPEADGAPLPRQNACMCAVLTLTHSFPLCAGGSGRQFVVAASAICSGDSILTALLAGAPEEP
jgi:hypothetical protein